MLWLTVDTRNHLLEFICPSLPSPLFVSFFFIRIDVSFTSHSSSPIQILTPLLPSRLMTAPHYLLANPFAGQNIGYIRLAVVGDSGVGKTLFARQFIETLPEVIDHDWEARKQPSEGDEDEDYIQTETLTEKFASTMMEIPWNDMDTDEEVPARNLVFLGKLKMRMDENSCHESDYYRAKLDTFLYFIFPTIDTPGYGSVADARVNFDLFLSHMGQCFEEKNQKISPFIDVSNNELMRSLVTGNFTSMVNVTKGEGSYSLLTRGRFTPFYSFK